MTLALIGLFGVLAVGFLVVLDRRDRRSTELVQTLLSAGRLEVAGMVERMASQAQQHREEVQTLLQRIQAPEVAVVQHQIDSAGPAEATMPLTDVESARRLQDEVLTRIVELERAEGLNG